MLIRTPDNGATARRNRPGHGGTTSSVANSPRAFQVAHNDPLPPEHRGSRAPGRKADLTRRLNRVSRNALLGGAAGHRVQGNHDCLERMRGHEGL